MSDSTKLWFLRAETMLDRGDRAALGELGMELHNLLVKAVLGRDVAQVWELYLRFTELTRQQENAEVQLTWFREPPALDWISETTRRIDRTFEPGGVDDELELLELLNQMNANMPDIEARVVATLMQRMIEANPAPIESEDHDALTNFLIAFRRAMLANEIRGKLYSAVSHQDITLINAIFHKIENDRHWWRTIFHDPIVQAWRRRVNYQLAAKEQQ